jgi:hypothetical protein
MSVQSILKPPLRTELETCVSALRKMAAYELEPELAQRLRSTWVRTRRS